MLTSSDWYVFFKDFSGPISTVAASATAAYVAWTLLHRQLSLTRSKLNLDMYDKKYAVFQTVYQSMSEVGVAIMLAETPPSNKIGIMRMAIDESEFFLNPGAINLLRNCEKITIEAISSDAKLDELFDMQKKLTIVFKPELRI